VHGGGHRAAAAGYALRQFPRRPSYARSFAYANGPAYGSLLDAASAGWRKQIKAGDDLSALLQRALALKLPADLAAQAAPLRWRRSHRRRNDPRGDAPAATGKVSRALARRACARAARRRELQLLVQPEQRRAAGG